MKIIGKGLKFTPTPNRNIIELKKGIGVFTRKLRLREYFSDITESTLSFQNTENLLIKKKCQTNPPRNRY